MELTPVFARLTLLASLQWAAENGQASRWSDADWIAFTRFLTPAELVIVALHGIRGLGYEEISQWFDCPNMSRGNVWRLWEQALTKLPVLDRAA